ncbi:MAG: tetratricopeptide repeat protein, partial [Desulfobacteria bacterium]
MLSLLILLVFRQVGSYPFINYDDGIYVYENPHVRGGLSKEGVSWAFTTFDAANWHPLTWLSHMTDVQLFGLDAGWHHRVNVLFHLANTALLFLVLWRMTGGLWQSAFVAALFAVHPLHVESVAWIAERKDVLSTLFWLLTMGAYLGYVRRPSVWRYLPVFVFLALGLMCKPMLVTLPFVLLLLDWWPLERLSLRTLGRRVLEKAPLLGLSALSCIITYIAQSQGKAVASLGKVTV